MSITIPKSSNTEEHSLKLYVFTIEYVWNERIKFEEPAVVLLWYKTSLSSIKEKEKARGRSIHVRYLRVINTEKLEKSHISADLTAGQTFRAANFAAKSVGKRRV